MRIRSFAQTLALTFFIPSFGFAVAAQSRDHLTPQEVEMVQESQVLDKRTEVFIKAIERRLVVLTATQAVNAKQLQKDSEKWGELPKGSRADLIGDIARILEEAITNIDDVGYHDEKNPLLPKALRKLNVTAESLVTQLNSIGGQAKSPEDISSVTQALENAQSIIDAAKKLPPPTEAEKASGKTKKPKG
jgi:hypothetical protein